jgi:integrase
MKLPIEPDTIDKYIWMKKNVWADSTCVTTRAKLLTIYNFKANSPTELLELFKIEEFSPHTIAVYFQLWRAFEQYCNNGRSVTGEFMKKNRRVFKNVYQSKTYFLSMEGYKTILRQAADLSDAMYNLVFLFGGCGLRLSEALNAKWEDISADNMLRVVGKGDKVRFVPIKSEDLKKINSPLIAGPRPPYRKFFKDKTCTAHDIRAFYATTMAGSLSIHELMDLLGHESFHTTLRYIRRNPMALKGKLDAHFKAIQGTDGSTHQSDRRKGG